MSKSPGNRVEDRTPAVGQSFAVDVHTEYVVPANDWLRLIAVAPGKDWYDVVGTVTRDSSRTHAKIPHDGFEITLKRIASKSWRAAVRLPRPGRWRLVVPNGTHLVNGEPIFGRSAEQVRAVLGAPDRVAYFSNSNGHPEPTFLYGGTSQGSAKLVVGFGWRQHRIRALSLAYQSPSLLDKKLGHVLRQHPLQLERRIQATYRTRYKLESAYGSIPSRGCVATFRAERGAVELSIGLNPYRPSRPYLNIRHGY